MESKIIFGFPGTGKTYAFEHAEELGLKLQDSDSSKFHWMYDDNGEVMLNEFGNKIEHPAWPANYAQYIELTGREQECPPDFIFVSTHKEVMEAIGAMKFTTFTVVPFPTDEEKEYYKELYKNRGSSPEFIDNMDKNWENFVDGTIDRSNDIESYLVILKHDGSLRNIYDFLRKNFVNPMEFEDKI